MSDGAAVVALAPQKMFKLQITSSDAVSDLGEEVVSLI